MVKNYKSVNWAVKTALPSILTDAGMPALAAKFAATKPVTDEASAKRVYLAVGRVYETVAKERRSGGQTKFDKLQVPEQLIASIQNACMYAKLGKTTTAQVENELEPVVLRIKK